MAPEHDGRFLSQDAIERRASGRRHYNSVRHFRAAARRQQVAELLAAGTTSRVQIARRLGVHASTVSRDVAARLCGRPFEPAC